MENKQKTIHARMAAIKAELSEIKIPKSGHNRFAGFKYHELSDFLMEINKLNQKHGVNDVINIDKANNQCSLTLYNVDDSKDYAIITTPYEDAEMLGKNGTPSKVDKIQRMGSTVTYNRRYLYMTAYNIQENDGVDNQPLNENKKPKVTPKKQPLTTERFAKALDALANDKIKKEDITKYDLTAEQSKQLDEFINLQNMSNE